MKPSSFGRLRALEESVKELRTLIRLISPHQFVPINKAAELLGYSERAMRHKIESGMWPEGLVWKWGEDGVQLIIMEGYNTWANRQGRASARGKHRSKSISGTTESASTRS